MHISFTFLQFKVLLNIIRAKDYLKKLMEEENPETYKPKGVSLRELAEKIGVDWRSGQIYRLKAWLEKDGVIKLIGKKKITREVGSGVAEFEVDGYMIDFEVISAILFDKWETRALFDRSHDYLYRDRPKFFRK